tara:strand:- start:1836 stop:2033 length:198 start_codon:yes stop_codon:yes gene_type:complete
MRAHQDVIDIIASYHDWRPVYDKVMTELHNEIVSGNYKLKAKKREKLLRDYYDFNSGTYMGRLFH